MAHVANFGRARSIGSRNPARRRGCARRVAMALMLAAGAAGCSLFHHGESAPQQFLDALNRGNAAQASQMWLNMSADDREALSHNQGIKASLTQKDMASAAARQRDRRAADGVTDPDSTGIDDSMTSDFENGDVDSQITEQPGLDIDPRANSLSDLPKLDSSTPAQIENPPQ